MDTTVPDSGDSSIHHPRVTIYDLTVKATDVETGEIGDLTVQFSVNNPLLVIPFSLPSPI